MTIGIIKKFTKNDKLLCQVIKLVRQNNYYKLSFLLTSLDYIENCSNFKLLLETDSELAVDDDLVLKSNQIVIPNDLQNHVISLTL